MNKQLDYVDLAEYTVGVAMINGKFCVHVNGIGADGKGSDYERDLCITEIDDAIGHIIERDVWEKEEALQDARTAQDRIDNPELYEDELDEATINTVFAQAVESDDEDGDEEYWLARTNGDHSEPPAFR